MRKNKDLTFGNIEFMAVINKISLSQLEFAKRIDGELYNPKYKSSYNVLINSGYPLKRLRNQFVIRSGTTPPDRDDSLNHGPILFKTTDIRNEVLNPFASYYHISSAIHARMNNTQLEADNVLLNIVGATLDVIGRSAYFTEYFDEANITQAMVLLRQKGSIFPGYLFAYLNTKFAQDQIKRFARPTGQYNLNLTEVGAIEIPEIDFEDQTSIDSLIRKSGRKNYESKSLHNQATQLLEDALGLNNINFKKGVSFVSSFSDVIASHRLDSNHFKPKFDQLLDHIKANFDYIHLGTSVVLNRRGVQPIYVPKGSKKVITSQHITATHLDYDNFERTSDQHYTASPEAHVKYGDILTYTTGAYVGQTNVYLDTEPALASNHVNIIRMKGSEIDPTYVAFVMNSLVGQLQTEKHIRGSAQAELYPNDMAKFIIPILNQETMASISQNVKDSLEARRKSKELLEQAKQEVETLIEQAAQTA